MVDIRPNALPDAILPLRSGDAIIVDQGADGVRQTDPVSMTDSVAPVATEAEAVAGSDNVKRMTPLRTKQSISSEIGASIASSAQGSKADSAVQSVNGKSGNSVNLVKSDVGLGNVDNTSDANKPISIATQSALNLKANDSVVVKSVNGMTPTGGNVTVVANEVRLQDTRSSAILMNFSPSDEFIQTSGYSTAGDGGGATYKKVLTEPSHIGKFQSADGAWWEIVIPSFGISVKCFGALGNGSFDDTAAIQGAINALPARGGTLFVPSGRYIIRSTINIGDGDGLANQSTKNAIKIIGGGAGAAVSGTLVSTIFSWYGAETNSPFINYRGKISNCDLKGIFLECRGLVAGILITSGSGFSFDEVKIVNPKDRGFAIIGGGLPTGNYNISNDFKRISCALFLPNSIGLYMDGVYSANNDTWLSKFELCRFEAVAGATSAVCAWFKFVDSISFYRCHFVDYEPTATGAIFDALANHDFPSGMDFISCSIKNTVVYEDGTHKIRPNYFLNHGTADNEVIPNHPSLIGTTDIGLNFGPMGYNVGTGGSVTQATSKATSVALNRVNGRIIMNNALLAAGGLANFIFNNSFLRTSDVLIVNITGGASYGSYTLTVSDVQTGLAVLSLRNISAASLSEPVEIGFAIIRAYNS